jgi:hypothetical protein
LLNCKRVTKLRLLVVNFQPTDRTSHQLLITDLLENGAESAELAAIHTDPAEVDATLETLAGRRLVIEADLAGLNLVLMRLMRRGELDSVDTAVLAAEDIGYLTAAGLPRDRASQLRLAVTGQPKLVGVIKDDSGGLCADSAQLTPFGPDGWWVRAVVDDQRLCDGTVRALSVRRLAPDRLEAKVQTGRFRSRTLTGRSLQLACDPALIVADGIARERPRSKRTFWSEPALWRLAL